MGIQFYNRVIYRPEYGYTFSYYQNRIDQIIESYANPEFCNDPDNIIELHNTIQYILEIDRDDICAEQKTYYKSHLASMKRIIGIYFSKITPENFMEIAKKTHPQYASCFWELMCRYKKIAEINSCDLKAFLWETPHHLDDVMMQKDMAIRFSEILYECFNEHPARITIIISALLAEQKRSTKSLYVKAAFNSTQINSLFKRYIRCEAPNINQLRLIHISQNDSEIGLDDEIRLLAKRKEEALSKKLFENSIPAEYGIGVSFGPYDEWKCAKTNDEGYTETYDNRWISENLDYPTLLDNFIYWLEYTDFQCRSNLPIREHQISALEDITIVKGKKTYNTGQAFRATHFLQLIQMQGYYEQLNSHNIHLEDIFKWFFEEYLPAEFHVDKFAYTAPTTEASYLEKCKLIAGEIESVLKQFKLYQKYGCIDRELFEMSSEHIFFSKIPSLLSWKYVYAKSDLVKWCMCYLFDDCMLGFSSDNQFEDCDNLFEVMKQNKSMPRTAFAEKYQERPIQCLLEFGILVDINGILSLEPAKTKLLQELHDNGVICYHHSNGLQETIENLIVSEDFLADSTLFSSPEQDYLNYILNKATFSNGLDLRNKYSHGSNPRNDNENFKDYLEFLLVMVMVIIKINDEFCTTFPEQ